MFLAVVAIAGPYLTVDPTEVDFEQKNIPPVGFASEQSIYDVNTGQMRTTETPGTWQHPLGTDKLGIFPGQQGGSFSEEPAATISAPATPFLTVLDVNGDRRSDLLLWYSDPEREGHIRVYLNGN